MSPVEVFICCNYYREWSLSSSLRSVKIDSKTLKSAHKTCDPIKVIRVEGWSFDNSHIQTKKRNQYIYKICEDFLMSLPWDCYPFVLFLLSHLLFKEQIFEMELINISKFIDFEFFIRIFSPCLFFIVMMGPKMISMGDRVVSTFLKNYYYFIYFRESECELFGEKFCGNDKIG